MVGVTTVDQKSKNLPLTETVHQFNDVDSDSGVVYIGDAVFKALDSFIGPSVLPAICIFK